MSDYIPSPDAQLVPWINNLVNYAGAHLAAMGLVTGDLTELMDASGLFSSAFDTHLAAQAAALAATEGKDGARGTAEEAIRALAKKIRGLGKATDMDLESMGLPVYDSTHTPVPPPTTAPLAIVDGGQSLQHVLRVVDSATPSRRAKPVGVTGAEVWMSIGTEPTDPSQMQCVGVHTNHHFVQSFDGADAGKRAFYRLRWYNRRGEKGPWSEMANRTIAA